MDKQSDTRDCAARERLERARKFRREGREKRRRKIMDREWVSEVDWRLADEHSDSHTYVWYISHTMKGAGFEWDEAKDLANQAKHGVPFSLAQLAFLDTRCLIAEDLDHSGQEQRFFCFGWVEGGVMTVRFTYRDGRVRIFGAGYWRKGKKAYEEANG